MKKRQRSRLPGASIRNTDSELASKGKWKEQSRYNSNLQYVQVYEALDELSLQGYTCLQIREIIELGLETYKANK